MGKEKYFSMRCVSIDTFTNRLLGIDNMCSNKVGLYHSRFFFAHSYTDTLYKFKSKQIEFAIKNGFTKKYTPKVPSKVEKFNLTKSYNIAKLEAYHIVKDKGIDIYNRGHNKMSHYLIEFDLGINDNDCIIEDANNTITYKLYFSNKGLKLANYTLPIIISIDKSTTQVKNPIKWSLQQEILFRERVDFIGNDWLLYRYWN